MPDLVLLPGDFIATESSDVSDLSPLAHIHAPLGTFAVMGNHDMGRYQTILGQRYMTQDRTNALRAILKGMGITILENENRMIDRENGGVAIAGVDDEWSGRADVHAALSGIPPGTPIILLSHTPDVVLHAEARRADLIVAGHTHGGQFRLPFIGPIAPIPTKLGRKYDQGIFRISDHTTLAITRGAGETMARARLFAWPEVLVLEAQSS